MKNKPTTWYYYLHTNGDLIGKNPVVVDSDPRYFDSPFVKEFWHINLSDRESMWRMILEALAKGAQVGRVKELAVKWKMDFADSMEFLARFKPQMFHREGMEIFIVTILGMKADEYWEKVLKEGKKRNEKIHPDSS